MKFYGRGIVWDAERNKPLCTFDRNGELEVSDERTCRLLVKHGYRHDDELPKPKQGPKGAGTPPRSSGATAESDDLKELRARAKAAGIKGYGIMNAETLQRKLKEVSK